MVELNPFYADAHCNFKETLAGKNALA